MLAKALKRMKYVVIGWSIRSLDTVKKNGERVVQKVKRRIKPGAVILLHDRCIDSELVVDDIAKYVVEQGYTFVRPDILFNLKPYD
jgi:peptidoglycan/xylan/chitin deacetylase (PgdA/CDA1 family)